MCPNKLRPNHGKLSIDAREECAKNKCNSILRFGVLYHNIVTTKSLLKLFSFFINFAFVYAFCITCACVISCMHAKAVHTRR